ncbi:MAG: hypothetical protein Q9227_006626 [Pyrenula ochraceoflavens]
MAPIFKSLAAMTAMLSTLSSAAAVPMRRQAPPGIVLQTVTQTATSWERIDVTVTITVGGATVTPQVPANTTPTVNTVSQVAVDGTFYTVITTSTTVNMQTTYALPGGTGAPSAPAVTAAPPTQPSVAQVPPPQSSSSSESAGGQFFQSPSSSPNANPNPAPASVPAGQSTTTTSTTAPAGTSSTGTSGGSTSGGFGQAWPGAQYPIQVNQDRTDNCPHGTGLGTPGTGTKAPSNPSSPCSSESDYCAGDMTHYDVATSPSNPSSCGMTNDGSTDNVVALSYLLMPGSEYCGKTINLFNPLTGKSATAKVVDKCMGCDISTSIDMSNHLYEQLDGSADNTYSCGRTGGVEWYFA